MKTFVTYIRSGREPHVLAARLEQQTVPAMDELLERLGFSRVGKQEKLLRSGLAICSKCGSPFDSAKGGAVLTDEAFCRPCIRRYWGGER